MISQSQIDAMLKQSDFEDSSYKASQIQSQLKPNPTVSYNKKIQQSNDYGNQQFQDYEESRRITNQLSNNFTKPVKAQKSSVYDSYANQQFQSYQQSRRNKQFQRSTPNINNVSKNTSKDLKPIQQVNSNIKKDNPSDKKKQNNPKKNNFINETKNNQSNNFPQQIAALKKKSTNLIFQVDKIDKPKSKSKQISSKTQVGFSQNNNLPYNYNRLQQRQRQLLFTTLAEQNKNLKQTLAHKQKQLSSTKTKYNILLEQKAQTLGNAKQATLIKRLQTLQGKYDALLKQKAQQRAYKTVAHMSKTMNQNVISQAEARQRQQQLLNIIQKLKQRLVSTDKQLKTLQIKMNEGLDYQQQLKRKLHRVQQLQLRLQKMKNQAEDDRMLIQTLKQKTQQQKTRIQQLQRQKNQLEICLRRAQMTEATHSDILEQLKQTRKQKQLLQKSLRQISLNFTKNLTSNNNKKAPKSQFQNIQDSNEFINYKR